MLCHLEERLLGPLQHSHDPAGLELRFLDHLRGVAELDLVDLELVFVLHDHPTIFCHPNIQIQVNHLVAILGDPSRRSHDVDEEHVLP